MLPFFHLPNNITIASGTWQATPIADAFVASSAIWNAKATTGTNTFSGKQTVTLTTTQAQFGYSSTVFMTLTVGATGGTTFATTPAAGGFIFAGNMTATGEDSRLPNQRDLSADSIATRGSLAVESQSITRAMLILGL